MSLGVSEMIDIDSAKETHIATTSTTIFVINHNYSSLLPPQPSPVVTRLEGVSLQFMVPAPPRDCTR